MAAWKVVRVIQQGIVMDPNDWRRTGQPTILGVLFHGKHQREVHFAPTIDRDGIRRTLDSMADGFDAEPTVQHGPKSDDLLGMESET